MEIEILNVKGSKPVGKVTVEPETSIYSIKKKIQAINKSLYPDRQALKAEPKGKSLKDEDTVASLNLSSDKKLYLKDLGPQVSWRNVFLAEYAGPLFVYLWVYQRPSIFYEASATPPDMVATVAAVCWIGHYAKRLFETVFIHRFSHGTMPLNNLFRNCAYYWLFALYVAYHVNHPLYTPPCSVSFYIGLGGFIVCELGNLSVHILLKNLRPPGTKVRRIPKPDGNPLCALFNYVSCPNYTYEVGSWLFFTIMTKCAPAGLFMLAGFYQMTVWALGKHRNYKKEFPDYPKGRKAIIPFVL